MPKSGYVDVGTLQAQLTLEQAAALCGRSLDLKGNGKEMRLDCPFGCPGEHAGRREISVNTDNPQKIFCCHSYGCQFRGNLLTLLHGWTTGQRPTGDKLKGEEFQRAKQILLQGVPVASRPIPPQPISQPIIETQTSPLPDKNIPLECSDDPKVQELATLDTKLVRELAHMNPAAANYMRKHPSLSFESLNKWKCGYLPHDGGGDKRGWSLRGHIIYPLFSEDNKVLAWIGRDPQFTEKEEAFLALHPAARAEKTPPMKHKIPKGFQRGLELYGQQAIRLKEPGYREAIALFGIIVVEGFNDVIALDNHGIPAVGLMSNRITVAQVEKITRYAQQLSQGKVTLLLDCDSAGDDGAKEALWLLGQRQLQVRLAWSQHMHAGKFQGVQPEMLSREMLMSLLQKS